MIAAFTSGAAFSLVSSAGGAAANPMQAATQTNPLMAAFSSGVIFALFQGGFYKVRQGRAFCKRGRPRHGPYGASASGARPGGCLNVAPGGTGWIGACYALKGHLNGSFHKAAVGSMPGRAAPWLPAAPMACPCTAQTQLPSFFSEELELDKTGRKASKGNEREEAVLRAAG
jgi:hypothetical protein